VYKSLDRAVRTYLSYTPRAVLVLERDPGRNDGPPLCQKEKGTRLDHAGVRGR
jgi:hypothetical protein